MSVDALVDRFEDAATREYATRFVDSDQPSMSLYNRISDEVFRIADELKRRDASSRLLPFLDSQNIIVRAEAARATHFIAPARAEAVMEAIVARRDAQEWGSAPETLKQWRESARVADADG
jgi:Domain of unknown function (DUF2019)